MAISSLDAITSDRWSLISSATPASGASTVTFTSIPARRKLLLVVNDAPTSVARKRQVLLNASTTDTDYIRTFIFGTSAGVSSGNEADNCFELSEVDTNFSPYEYFMIDSADTSGPKEVKWGGFATMGSGIFLASAPIDQVQYKLASSGTFSASTGSLKLYGTF